MTSSPDPTYTEVLRGTAATQVAAAHLSVELRSNRYQLDGAVDARLADPAIRRAFEQIADEARAAARAEGYATGWAAGHLAAAEVAQAAAMAAERDRVIAADAASDALSDALRALADAALRLEQRAVVPAEQLRDAVLQGGLELAEALLGREVRLSDAPGLDAVRRALSLTPVGVPVIARLNSADLPAIRAALVALPDDALGRPVQLVADDSVEPAGCIVECEAVRVDAQLSTALARVREVLSA